MRLSRPLAVTTVLLGSTALLVACGSDDADDGPQTITVTSTMSAPDDSQDDSEPDDDSDTDQDFEAAQDDAPAPVAADLNLSASADQVGGNCGTIGQLSFSANENTSCGFAANVASAAAAAEFYIWTPDPTVTGVPAADITATSPTTGETYEMRCLIGSSRVAGTCSGGNDASVSITRNSTGPLSRGEDPGPIYLNP